MQKILVVDDERMIRLSLKEILLEENYNVEEAKDGEEALDRLVKSQFDLVICDIKMPKVDGLEVLKRIKEAKLNTQVILITAHGNMDIAMEAIRFGAFDFIQKPPDLNQLLISVRNALNKNTLIEETKVLKKKIYKVGDIIGNSNSIEKVKETIDKVAQTDARVLITGENGSGKELVAKWLHAKSYRSDYPLIEVNCAAIPSELIESELFGHEKGSFTSAVKQRIGKFEQANQGTIFLDEIGDMSLAAQAKVLRVLEEHKITRVGANKVIPINTRVLAATNKDLKTLIKAKVFREDLYHRLSVIIIKVPSLKDRIKDIPLLITHFMKVVSQEYGQTVKPIAKEAVTELQKHSWTGNVRELRNAVERLIIMSNKTITKEDVITHVT